MFKFFRRQSIDVTQKCFMAFVSGIVIPLEQVADPVFSQKMLGDGIAILPNEGVITAPCAGKVTMLYPTLHAVGLLNDDGIEVLIHIGINTVDLKGEGFESYVTVGEVVSQGDRLIHFDEKYLAHPQYNFTTMLLFPNTHKTFEFTVKKNVWVGKDIIAIINEEEKDNEK